MTERKFTLDGFTIVLCSKEEGEDADMELALQEILLEEVLRNGGEEVYLRVDEIARRLVSKGFDPDTGKRLN
ncbi:hypothetical protein [uncultured Desulfovibrio sp.]|uniref:hypothetical protein n=1 Tax=uncultured Desulfovibrio sp. TaxID=167968 RepID=UPI0025FE4B89|nr:hypothetical protein [uncultured Desulfovibrio sp.]